MNQKLKKFILEHRNEDAAQLALKAALFPEIDMPLAIRQIRGMQKVKNKIPAFFSSPDLLYPAKLSIEQSSSEITAKYKAGLCSGQKLVDLTGGFGVDCFFMSENFNEVAYVEKNTELCVAAQHNFKILGRKNITIENTTAEDFLKNNFKADWIFIDPARRDESGRKTALLSDCEPDISKLQEKIFEKSPNAMVKLSPMFDLTQLRRELKNIREIHIISVENECKEVLAILQKNYFDKTQIKTVHHPKNKPVELFDFAEEDEKNQTSVFAEKTQKYLYEPNASILKAGAFKSAGNLHGIYKLHINSHLYTSDKLIMDFPGRLFEVERVVNFNKEGLKKLKLDQANVAIRNFPLDVNELRKKLKIKDGGKDFIFATTIKNNKILVVCRKII